MFRLLIFRGFRWPLRLALTALVTCALVAATTPAAAGPGRPSGSVFVYLPLIHGPIFGITGSVTNNGQPAANAGDVKLVRCNPQCNGGSIINTVQTDNLGKYLFVGVPSLLINQKYQVIYVGNSNGYLNWSTPEVTSYISNTLITMPTFDIAGINHVTPADGASVTLPYEFQWTPRPATPQDHYSVTFSSDVQFNGSDVGHAGSYTLPSLPLNAPFGPTHSYFWKVSVAWTDGSTGYQFLVDASRVYFNNSGAVGAHDSIFAPDLLHLLDH